MWGEGGKGSSRWKWMTALLMVVCQVSGASSDAHANLSVVSQPTIGFVNAAHSPPFVVGFMEAGVSASWIECRAETLLSDGDPVTGLGSVKNASVISGNATFSGLTVGIAGGNLSIVFRCRNATNTLSYTVMSNPFGMIHEATQNSITSLSLSHVLQNVPVMLQFIGAPYSIHSFAGVAKAGFCNRNTTVVIPLSSGIGNQSGYVLLPPFNETGAYKICLSSSGGNGEFVEQLWVQLNVATITGVTPSSVLITGKRDNNVRLTCIGNCYGPQVRIGLMPLDACDCSSLVAGQSVSYGDPQHSGEAPAQLPFSVNQTGQFRICWSPDDGDTYFSQTAGFRAIADSSPSSITMFYPYFATKLVDSTLIFSGAQHSTQTFLGFIPTSAVSCSQPIFNIPVLCSGNTNCSDASATLTLTVPYSVPEGQYQVCYSVSGVNGTYELQINLPYNLTMYERQCPAYLCEPGEVYVTVEDAPFGSSCMKCSAGSYSLSGQGNCTRCPAGFQCNNPAIMPVRCFSGSYSKEGATACTLCDAGMACPSPDVPPQPCGPGEYSDVGQPNCSNCAPGYYSLYTSWGGSSNCSYSATRGATNCTRCPPGHSCEPDGLPVPCPAGSYSAGGIKYCLACNPGFYSLNSSSFCIRCPAGSACPHTNDNPLPCQAGYASAGGLIRCSICSPGTFSSESDRFACIPCPSGTACPGNGTIEPNPCLAGTSAASGSHNCTKCPVGLYSDAGAVACQACPQGYQCDMGLRPQPCPPGAFAPHNSTSCMECPAGFFANTSSAGFCLPCPAGFRCPRASIGPFPCNPGYYSSSGSFNCTPCSNGTYAPSPSMEACIVCPAGYNCPMAASFARMCEAGQYSPPGSQQCLACADGFWSTFGYQICKMCPPGSYCPAGLGPFPCPRSTYSPGQIFPACC